MLTANDKEYAQNLGKYVMEAAELTPQTIDKLQELSWREYLDVAYVALERMQKEYPQA